jgi:heat-inducible transcriptional repressor
MSVEMHYSYLPDRNLSARERAILRSIVQTYILTAAPVGSRLLSRIFDAGQKLSPATIRNVMADLEDMEFISHPHTSAGRVPTDKGYRLYVDTLMDTESLSENERAAVNQNLLSVPQELALRDASRLLGSLSHYLAIVELPSMADIIIHRLQLVPLSSQRLLVVAELESKLVRTVTLETNMEYDPARLEQMATYINSRISGRSIRYIRENFPHILNTGDSHFAHNDLFRLFVESVDSLFQPYQPGEEKLHIAGARNLVHHPEFENPEHMRGIIELVENEDVIIHLLDRSEPQDPGSIRIMIGHELGEEKLQNYSLVLGSYSLNGGTGSIGLIGPKRMNYSRMVSLVEYVAGVLSHR